MRMRISATTHIQREGDPMEQDKLDTLLVTQVLILARLIQAEKNTNTTAGYYVPEAVKLVSQSRERILQMLSENHS
ncbi:hypothetical protein EFP20_25120 [Burkholderia glumae]|nr:hypothetical protein EFP20_25120 [Burkholderia glumae]